MAALVEGPYEVEVERITLRGEGGAPVEAIHEARYGAVVDTTNAALVGASGGHAENDLDTDAIVNIGAGVRIATGTGDTVLISSLNRFLQRNTEESVEAGGGGGHMWMEVPSEKRVNIIRTEELLESKPDVIGTACPFCLAMMDLGRKVKEVEGTVQVKDISELVADSLE